MMPFHDRRRGRRVAVTMTGVLSGNGYADEVTVADLSDGGVLVETRLPPRLNERLTLAIEGWPPKTVVVRWAGDGRAGLALDR